MKRVIKAGYDVEGTVYTCFPLEDGKPSESYLPQDFSTWEQAVEYGELLPCDYTVEKS